MVEGTAHIVVALLNPIGGGYRRPSCAGRACRGACRAWWVRLPYRGRCGGRCRGCGVRHADVFWFAREAECTRVRPGGGGEQFLQSARIPRGGRAHGLLVKVRMCVFIVAVPQGQDGRVLMPDMARANHPCVVPRCGVSGVILARGRACAGHQRRARTTHILVEGLEHCELHPPMSKPMSIAAHVHVQSCFRAETPDEKVHSGSRCSVRPFWNLVTAAIRHCGALAVRPV